MAICAFEDRVPTLGDNVYVHPSADIIGLVTLGDECFVGPGARLRGDYGEIVIGQGTSIEENCVIHARPDQVTRIGDYVTVGHGSIIHTATVEDYVVLGMGSIVSDYATVGEWAAVGEGAVVSQGTDAELLGPVVAAAEEVNLRLPGHIHYVLADLAGDVGVALLHDGGCEFALATT